MRLVEIDMREIKFPTGPKAVGRLTVRDFYVNVESAKERLWDDMTRVCYNPVRGRAL